MVGFCHVGNLPESHGDDADYDDDDYDDDDYDDDFDDDDDEYGDDFDDDDDNDDDYYDDNDNCDDDDEEDLQWLEPAQRLVQQRGRGRPSGEGWEAGQGGRHHLWCQGDPLLAK